MKFGVAMFNTDYSIRIDDLAREVEARGFESLWVPEHTHIPKSRKSPWPGGPNLPKEYWHTHDPFVALATAAAATTRLKVGTGICLVIERDPITLAKEVASLDFLSGGRFLFGIGGGWNAEEMENHGTDFKKRWRVLRERILAMKEIWTKDEPEFHGEFVNFDPIWSYPKPVQKPHPPIFLGVNTPKARERVVEYCDGWFPLAGRAGDLAAAIADLRRLAEKARRDPKSLSVSVYAAATEENAVRQYEKAGAERIIFYLPSAERDTVLPVLDKYAKLIQAFK
ncbi:MAG TPA: LLM class F420-dependent oxidoreductase [archaeon]|nr:LLM class F420-dependent oxidoreductase [archaeon]